jgi:hypothetical protein
MFCVVGTNTPWPCNPKTPREAVSTSTHCPDNRTLQQREGEPAAYHERVKERLARAVLTALRIVQQLSPTRTPCSVRSRIDRVHRPERAQATPPRDVVCVPSAVRFAGGEAMSARVEIHRSSLLLALPPAFGLINGVPVEERES